MRIDCHIHVNWQGYDADKMVAHYDALGIDKAWVHTWEESDGLRPHYQHLSFAEMWAACKKHPNRLVPFYAPDPKRPDAERVLKEAIKKGIKGFGECKVRMCINNPDLVRLFRVAGDAGLPVLFHMDKPLPPTFDYWYNHDMDGLARVLEMLPHVNFVGHGPGFWRHVSGDEEGDPRVYTTGKVAPGGKVPKFLRRYPNLYCDLSAGSGLGAVSRDRAWGRRFLVRHSDRVLYGTDMFTRELLDYLEGLRLDAKTMRRIMGGNAAKLLPK